MKTSTKPEIQPDKPEVLPWVKDGVKDAVDHCPALKRVCSLRWFSEIICAHAPKQEPVVKCETLHDAQQIAGLIKAQEPSVLVKDLNKAFAAASDWKDALLLIEKLIHAAEKEET